MKKNTIASLKQRYMAALHAVQAGIAVRMSKDAQFVSPKHLRVGIDSAHISEAALARLLIAKGIFTEEEYLEALATEAEAEKARAEAELSATYGGKITLV